MYQKSEQKVIL